MQNHHYPTVTHHARAEKRQDYARLYLCVKHDASAALCDSKDGLVLAWTDWSTAAREAGRSSMIVVNWQWFLQRYLDRLTPRPTAARLFVATLRGTLQYHAEFDASAEQIRSLDESPRNAKVWPEGAA